MLIRRYQAQDIEEVKRLHYSGLAQFGAEADPYHDNDLDDIEGIYINNHGDFLVGIVDDKIVAMGALKKVSSNQGEIKRVRVHRDYQKQGYGQKMLSFLIETAVGLGYTELRLDTIAGNTAAERLFTRLGFQETRRGQVGKYDLIFYKKTLVQP